MIIGVDISVLFNEIQAKLLQRNVQQQHAIYESIVDHCRTERGQSQRQSRRRRSARSALALKAIVARRWFESKQFMRNIKRRKRFTYVSCDRYTTRSIENPYRALMALFQHKKLL